MSTHPTKKKEKEKERPLLPISMPEKSHRALPGLGGGKDLSLYLSLGFLAVSLPAESGEMCDGSRTFWRLQGWWLEVINECERSSEACCRGTEWGRAWGAESSTKRGWDHPSEVKLLGRAPWKRKRGCDSLFIYLKAVTLDPRPMFSYPPILPLSIQPLPPTSIHLPFPIYHLSTHPPFFHSPIHSHIYPTFPIHLSTHHLSAHPSIPHSPTHPCLYHLITHPYPPFKLLEGRHSIWLPSILQLLEWCWHIVLIRVVLAHSECLLN